MAYLPGFEHDIFVSYSHVDDLGDVPWIKVFHEALEVALAKRVGRMGVIKLWRDTKRLQGNQAFDTTIREALEKSALFLALTSYGYLRSDYCRQELRWFHQKAQSEPQGLLVGDRMRICNVLLTRLPPPEWPQEYGRSAGFAFHDADDQPEDPDVVGMPTDLQADRQRYHRQLNALVNALHRTLEAFRGVLGAEQPAGLATAVAETAGDATGLRVFLADVADPLAATRKRLVAELEHKGVVVESGVPPPFALQAHDDRVAAACKDTMLGVHLLAAYPGREIDELAGPGNTYPLRQLEQAGDKVRSQLVWVPPELDTATVEDEDYRTVLQRYEKGERGSARFDFVRGSSALLVPQILEKLEQLRKAAQAPAEPAGAMLLDTHLKDQFHAFELGKLLFARRVQPYINPQEDDPTKNLDAFESRLRSVSKLVILFGQVSEDWVRHRLGVALQLSVVNNLPIRSFCVLLMPPAKKASSLRIGPVPIREIDNSHSDQLDVTTLSALCEDVEGTGP